MNYDNIEEYLSKERLNRYLRACNNKKSQAMSLYRVNLRLSQSFYPILNLFETILRNALYNQISIHFNDWDWIINQKQQFMSDTSLTRTRYFIKIEVERAEKNIRKRSKIVSASKVVAEQNFGFWTSFFDTHHFKLIEGTIIKAFPHKPAHVNRKEIALILKDIREFRNRVYHNEPICFKGNSKDFSKAIQIRSNIFEMSQWIDPKLLKVLDYYDNILQKIPIKYSSVNS